jgi:hypothetical protein
MRATSHPKMLTINEPGQLETLLAFLGFDKKTQVILHDRYYSEKEIIYHTPHHAQNFCALLSE